MAKILANLKSKVNSKLFKKDHILKPKSFSDDSSPLCFFNLVFYLLKIPTHSSRVELDDFFEKQAKSFDRIKTVSTSALCQARQKLKHTVFTDMNALFCKLFYTFFEIQTWHSRRLIAIDGTTVTVPDTDENLKYFGGWNARNGKSPCPKARGSVAFDPLNGITVDALLRPKKYGEERLFLEHLHHLEKGDLVLADRGYAGFKIFSALFQRGIDFCIRLPTKQYTVLLDTFMHSNKKDTIIEFYPNAIAKKKCLEDEIPVIPVKLRLIKIKLDSGEIEILATSVFDKKIKVSDFSELYHQRWIVEELYKNLKSKVCIEAFSGILKEVVLQDFHASFLSMNLAVLFTKETESHLKKQGVKKKYSHKINVTYAFSKFKEYFIRLVFDRHPERILEYLFQLYKKYTIPIRDGRKVPRKKKPQRSGFFLNYKAI